MRLGRSVAAMAGSTVITVMGLFIGVSPWLEGLNSGRGTWSSATKVDFWSGLGFVVVGLATILAYRASLARDLMQAGVISRQPSLEPANQEGALVPTGEAAAMTDAALLALATSVVKDIQRSEGQENATASAATSTGLATHDQSPVGDADLVRLAASLLAEIQGEQTSANSTSEAPPAPADTAEEPLELMSESELARMAAELLEEIQRTSPREMATMGEEGAHE